MLVRRSRLGVTDGTLVPMSITGRVVRRIGKFFVEDPIPSGIFHTLATGAAGAFPLRPSFAWNRTWRGGRFKYFARPSPWPRSPW